MIWLALALVIALWLIFILIYINKRGDEDR